MRGWGWALLVLGFVQMLYAGVGFSVTLPASPDIANSDLIAMRAMIHLAGCTTFVAGAVFLAAAHIRDGFPPPPKRPVSSEPSPEAY